MRIENRADSQELANVLVAEWSWNQGQLITYAVAHRGPRVVWTSSTRKTRGIRCLISGFLVGDFPFRLAQLRDLGRELAKVCPAVNHGTCQFTVAIVPACSDIECRSHPGWQRGRADVRRATILVDGVRSDRVAHICHRREVLR